MFKDVDDSGYIHFEDEAFRFHAFLSIFNTQWKRNKCWKFCPCAGGSHSPISWKKYPFLDIPEGGASVRAKQRKTVITELNLGNGNRPGREQLLVIIFTQQLLVWEMLWIQIRIIFRPLCHSGLLYMEKIYAFKGKTQSNPRIICLQAKVFVL